jgi:hypothetical protein
LRLANEKITDGVGLLDVKIGQTPDIQRIYFIPILYLLSTDIAIWIALYVRHKHDNHAKGYRKSLQQRIDRTCKILETGLKMIEDFEHEVLGPAEVRSRPNPHQPPQWQGYVVLTRMRYGGSREVAGEWYNYDAPAIDYAHHTHSNEESRIATEAKFREDHIYTPTHKYMDSLRKFKVSAEAA